MQSWSSRRNPKLYRVALWLVMVAAPLAAALIVIRGLEDGWDYCRPDRLRAHVDRRCGRA